MPPIGHVRPRIARISAQSPGRPVDGNANFAHLAAQETDEWATLKRQDFSAESYQALVLLCLGGLAEHLVRQTHDVGGVRHVLRARVSGDYFKQFELSSRHQAEIHFGSGYGAAARQGPEIEAMRLTEEGLAISEDDARFLLGRIQAGVPASPSHIEWLGWEALGTTADSGDDHDDTAEGASRPLPEPASMRIGTLNLLAIWRRALLTNHI